MKNKILLFCLFVLFSFSEFRAQDLTIDKNFGVITSQQAQGYLKPFFTTLEESWNTGLYSSARYNGWSLAIDFVAMGMFIPSSQQTFDAELPLGYSNQSVVKTGENRDGIVNRGVFGTSKQPTIYGGSANPIFAAPQNHLYPDTLYRSIAFIEGHDISQMPGLPSIQIIFGTPLLNQFRFRYLMVPIKSNSLSYYMIGYNQNIDKIFGLFNERSRMGLALNFAYHKFKRDPEISMESWSAGLHFSKTWSTWFTLYLGGQVENISGKFKAPRELSTDDDVVNSPYEEIRNGADLAFDIEGFTKYRFGGGLSMKLGSLELRTDAYYASQPVVSAGMSFWMFQPDDIIPEEKPVPMPLQTPKIDTVKKDTLTPPPIVEKEKALPPQELISEIKMEESQEVIRPKVLPKPKLIADITPFGEDDSLSAELAGALTLEERAMKRLSPLLPYVFFEQGDYHIPDRYVLLDTDDVKKINYKPIYGNNTLNNYYQMLNIIGGRLYEYPKAKITITGTNANFDDELKNLELSKKRAESVKNYFVNVWGIDEKRIIIKSRNLPAKFSNPQKQDGIEENRRAEISCDVYEVLAPCMLFDTLRNLKPPIIKFKTAFPANLDIETWEFKVMSNNRTLYIAKGEKEFPNMLYWDVNNDETCKNIMKNEIQYFATVHLKNKESLTTQLYKKPINVVTDIRSLTTKLSVYDLVLFDFGKADISANNKKIINFIKAETKGESKIAISGHTDRIGDSVINAKLSQKRAVSTKNALKMKNATAEGLGSRILLLDNNLPEGRLYSRNVSVKVETKKDETEGAE